MVLRESRAVTLKLHCLQWVQPFPPSLGAAAHTAEDLQSEEKRQPLIPASTPAWALCSHCKTDSKGSKSQKNLKRSIQASQQKPPHILAINFFLLFYCFKILLILHTKEFTCPGPARILTDKLLLPEEVQHGCCLPEISDPKPEGYKLNRHLLSQHIPLPLRSSDTQPTFTLQPFPKESRVF